MGIKKRNKIIIIAVVFLLALITASVIRSVHKYVDTHTWATIRMTAEINSDTPDSILYEHEYLKGDNIVIGNVTLAITKISTDGTVTFSVQQGELYNEAGKSIDADTIFKNAQSNYKLNDGVMSLTVTSNRYQ